jgi:hypothetical protein
MLNYVYAIGLMLAFAAMGYIDWRWRVALFRDPRRSVTVVVLTAALLIVFDVVGLALGVYRAGDRVVGLVFGSPDFPVEELFLLLFFGYFCPIMLRVHR